VTDQTQGFVEAHEVATPAGVLDLDLAPLRDHRRCGGRRLEEPLFLVCTNGRHDACCAEYGRPLARALAQAQPESTWECSHVGGDRFAGNLVCLPEGVYYGLLGPFDGPRVAAAHLDGRVDLEHYRGRSCHPFVVQAADYFARRELGLLGVHDLVAERLERLDGDTSRVVFATPDGRRVVTDVVVTADPDPRRLTCRAARARGAPRGGGAPRAGGGGGGGEGGQGGGGAPPAAGPPPPPPPRRRPGRAARGGRPPRYALARLEESAWGR
jgi:hypothetical protein